jgi:hypothetical protein
MSELGIAIREKHHLDTVGVQALVVDDSARKQLRLRWIVRLNIDPALQALEAMAVGIAEILVEGDTIRIHLALHSLRKGAAAYSRSIMPDSRQRVAPDDLMSELTRHPVGANRDLDHLMEVSGGPQAGVMGRQFLPSTFPAKDQPRRNGVPLPIRHSIKASNRIP